MKKQPLFLLEILIAMSLVALCITPLLKGPTLMHKMEMSSLIRIESSRVAAWTFTEIVEKLLKNEIRWETLPKLGEKSPEKHLSDVPLTLPPLPNPSVLTRTFWLSTMEEKKETDGRIHRLIAVHQRIGSQKREFTYRVIITKSSST